MTPFTASITSTASITGSGLRIKRDLRRASTSVRRDLAVACAVAATGAPSFAAPATAAPLKTTTAATVTHHDAVAQTKPTIVLAHGAWADTSGRNRVMSRLMQASYTAYAPFVASIPGPVVLAGHSYGGMVIANTAVGSTHVRPLVYDDANIRDEGETAFQINAAWPGSCITANPSTFLDLVRTPMPCPATRTPTSRTHPAIPTRASPDASPAVSRPPKPGCRPQASGPSR
ncbi:hypothetical protein ACWGQ5_47490 [Streptomyces sp. NPDC055722]